MKKYIIGFVFGAVILSGITVVLATNIAASNVGYKSTTVEAAINDLYNTATVTVTNLQNQNSSLTTTNSNLLELNGNLSSENDTLTSANQTLTQQNSTLTQENQTLTQENTELEAQLNNIPVSAGLKFCEKLSGTLYAIGSKYECDPGDGVKRNFYILESRNSEVDLIMENNLSDTVGTARTMTWKNAMKYFRTGAGTSIKNAWNNVMNVDLPRAQAIVDATGLTSWIASDSSATWWCFGDKAQDVQSSPYCTNSQQSNYAWLYNHLIGCKSSGCTTDSGATSYGYWTRDLIAGFSDAWSVTRSGFISNNAISNSSDLGVRPVITVLKSNLYSE